MTRFASRRRRACGCARARAVVVVAELAAALTNPLFRVLAAVDRGDAVAHPDRQQGGRHGGSTAGEGTVQVRTLVAETLSQNGFRT